VCARVRVCGCKRNTVEHATLMSGSANTEAQMSLDGFFHWSTLTRNAPWPSCVTITPSLPPCLHPSLPPHSAGTKRHLSCVDGEEKSQHFVQRPPRSGFTKSLTGRAARYFYASPPVPRGSGDGWEDTGAAQSDHWIPEITVRLSKFTTQGQNRSLFGGAD